MDSTSYLRKYGWKPGSGLHGTKGIQKPILVAHKTDVLGLGNKKHNHADAWWERAFDSSLKSLSVDDNGKTVQQTDKSGALTLLVTKGVAKDLSWEGQQSPLYRHFVKGNMLEGTFTQVVEEEAAVEPDTTTSSNGDSDSPAEHKSKKRKRRIDDKPKERSKKKDKKDKKSKKSKRESKLLLLNEPPKPPSDSGIEIPFEDDEKLNILLPMKKEKKDKKDKDKDQKKKKKNKEEKEKSRKKSRSKD